MEFVINDLSLAGQLPDLDTFRTVVARLMMIREAIQAEGRALYCHRNLLHAEVTPGITMPKAVQALPRDQRSVWVAWLSRQGPFWEDGRLHNGDTYLEVNGDVVTDSGVGEAAYCCLQGLERELVSVEPSRWLYTPIVVKWVRDLAPSEEVQTPNHWTLESVERSLAAQPEIVDSWSSLEASMRRSCDKLIFADDAFHQLDGCPFAYGAAMRIQVLLRTLNRLRVCVDEDGKRSDEGHRIYADHFTGAKAWFSDSSDSEKREFATALVFRHPERKGETIVCSWHGKVKSPQLRIHFSWPVSADEPLYVVYVGPKLTKR